MPFFLMEIPIFLSQWALGAVVFQANLIELSINGMSPTSESIPSGRGAVIGLGISCTLFGAIIGAFGRYMHQIVERTRVRERWRAKEWKDTVREGEEDRERYSVNRLV